MSIDLSLGVLANVTAADREASGPFLEHVEWLFGEINKALRSRGLPEHHEPRSLPVSPPSFTLSSGLYPFRDFADSRESDTDLRFPHVLACAQENFGVFVPVRLDEVILVAPRPGDDLGGSCGSSYRLLTECRALASFLGILPDLDEDAEGESVHPWPEGADGCQKLYSAARLSIAHGYAIVIH